MTEVLIRIQLQIIIQYKPPYLPGNRAYAAFINNPVNQFNIATCNCSTQQVSVILQHIKQYSGYIDIDIYIYIYRERERERESNIYYRV